MNWEKRWFQFSILFLLAFVWGSSFILMKIGLKSFNSYQAAAIRMLLASLVLFPIALKNLKFLKRKDLPALLIAGFIGSFIPAFLFTKAQTRIDSALAGILNSLTPVFTLLIGILFLRVKTKLSQLSGLVLGLSGAFGLIAIGQDISLDNFNSYALFIVVATICYATNVNVVKSTLTHLKGAQITAFSFMFIWPFALVILLLSDFTPVFDSPGWAWHFAALATLGIVGTALAMLLMNSLIRFTSAVTAASVTYIIPIFALMWGIIDGETFGLLQFLFMALILLGIYLINRK